MNGYYDLLERINALKKKVCCCEGDLGITELSPPVSEPTTNGATVLVNLSTMTVYLWDGSAWVGFNLNNLKLDQFGIGIDGEGVPISDGYKFRLRVPYSGTITGFTLLEVSENPIAGSVVIDVKKGTFAGYDTTPVFSSIAGSELPTLSNSVAAQDLSLTTWTTSFAAGDLFEISASGVVDVERIYLAIHVTKD